MESMQAGLGFRGLARCCKQGRGYAAVSGSGICLLPLAHPPTPAHFHPGSIFLIPLSLPLSPPPPSPSLHLPTCHQSELQIMARLSHPNIVHVYGGCILPPNIFVVVELMQSDLSALLHCHCEEDTGAAAAAAGVTAATAGPSAALSGDGRSPPPSPLLPPQLSPQQRRIPLSRALGIALDIIKGLVSGSS